MTENQEKRSATTSFQTAPLATPQKKQKPWLLIALTLLVLISLGTNVLLVNQNFQLKQQIAQTTKQVSERASFTNNSPEIPSGWEKYTNTEYRFEVEYPPTWEIKEINNFAYYFVSFLPPEANTRDTTGSVGIMIEKGGTLVTTDTEALNRFQSFMDTCSSQTPTQCDQRTSDDYKIEGETTIDDRLAFQTYGGCCMDIGRHIFLYHDIYLYRFTLYNLGPNIPNLKNENIFNQILSTFEFIE